MTPAQALDAIRAAAAAGRITYSRSGHAQWRMGQEDRLMTVADVRSLLMSSRSVCSLSRDTGPRGEQRWKVEGFDLDDYPRTVVVQVDHGILVVTVW